MANKKLAERKKNKKAQEKDQAKVKSRLEIAKVKKEARQAALEEKKSAPKLEPIVNEVLVANSEALANIERNLQMLKDLEAEYIASQNAKENLQEELEAEGYKTLDEKMAALRLRATENAKQVSEISEELLPQD